MCLCICLCACVCIGEQRSVEEVWWQTHHWHSNLRGKIKPLAAHVYILFKTSHTVYYTVFQPYLQSPFVSLVQMGFAGIAVGSAMVRIHFFFFAINFAHLKMGNLSNFYIFWSGFLLVPFSFVFLLIQCQLIWGRKMQPSWQQNIIM